MCRCPFILLISKQEQKRKWKHICHGNKDVNCRTGLKDLDQRLQNGPRQCLYQASTFIKFLLVHPFLSHSKTYYHLKCNAFYNAIAKGNCFKY